MYKKVKKIIDDVVLNIKPVTRPSTKFVKERENDNELVVVEIGTELGYNALSILTELNVKKIYLIDPYEDYVMDGEVQKIGDAQKKHAMKVLSDYRDRIVLIRKYSQDAIGDIPDDVDFIYVDGNHDESSVKKDIELYYSKLKRNGVLAGHDFYADCVGLCKAVMEFSEKNKLKLYGKDADWWIVKP